MNIFKNMFTSQKVKTLQDEIQELKAKLDERQEAINKSNAYWKRKLNDALRKQRT